MIVSVVSLSFLLMSASSVLYLFIFLLIFCLFIDVIVLAVGAMVSPVHVHCCFTLRGLRQSRPNISRGNSPAGAEYIFDL